MEVELIEEKNHLLGVLLSECSTLELWNDPGEV